MKRFFLCVGLLILSTELMAEPAGVGQMIETSSVWRLFLSLGLLVALIPLVIWGLKRVQGLQGKLSKSAIRVVATQSIGAKERLLLVEVENQKFLLGATAQNIVCLKEFDSSGAQFAELMNEQLVDEK